MFVLTIGVLGVAALLPIGRMSLIKTEVADRTGACGRAALNAVKVRRMLDPNMWGTAPSRTDVFFIDPLGCLKISNTIAGQAGLPRINLQTYPGSGMLLSASSTPTAESIFLWQDDLAYALPKDLANGQLPTNGTRPMPICGTNSTQQVDGKFSWFLTVWASAADVRAGLPVSQRQTYTVAAVVCNRRDFTSAGEVVLSSGTCDAGTSYGGVGVTVSGTTSLKSNEWAMLYSGSQYSWYRAVGVGHDAAANQTRMTLLGPDWYGGTSASLLVVPGVTGVYTTTVQLDEDGTWSK